MRRTKSKLPLLCLLLSLSLYGCTQTAETDTISETAMTEPQEVHRSDDYDQADEKFSRVVFAMDTVMELTVYHDSETVLDLAAARITELEQKLSVTQNGSEIYTLNNTGKAVLSEDTAILMETALLLCQSTEGALDVTVYPVVRAWGFTTGNYRIPAEDELSVLLSNVDHTSVMIDEQNVSVSEGMQVDLGSVAKGYTGDVICELFRENGITSALLNLGGNVQALGNKPDGSPWRIAVQHPTDTENYLGVLSLENQAVITSGGYERYFTGDDGEIYWHIIDPSDGKPADSGIISVTIVGESGVLCDAMSTALFVMGLDDASEYWRNHKGFDFIIVTEDGNIHITEGVRDIFTLSEAHADKKLTVIER